MSITTFTNFFHRERRLLPEWCAGRTCNRSICLTALTYFFDDLSRGVRAASCIAVLPLKQMAVILPRVPRRTRPFMPFDRRTLKILCSTVDCYNIKILKSILKRLKINKYLKDIFKVSLSRRQFVPNFNVALWIGIIFYWLIHLIFLSAETNPFHKSVIGKIYPTDKDAAVVHRPNHTPCSTWNTP